MSPDRVASFQRAHHLAAFYWLVRDRLADGQVTADDQLAQARELLRQRWVDTLTAATEDPGVASSLLFLFLIYFHLRQPICDRHQPPRLNLPPSSLVALHIPLPLSQPRYVLALASTALCKHELCFPCRWRPSTFIDRFAVTH